MTATALDTAGSTTLAADGLLQPPTAASGINACAPVASPCVTGPGVTRRVPAAGTIAAFATHGIGAQPGFDSAASVCSSVWGAAFGVVSPLGSHGATPHGELVSRVGAQAAARPVPLRGRESKGMARDFQTLDDDVSDLEFGGTAKQVLVRHRVLFTEKVKFRLEDIPRWRPQVSLAIEDLEVFDDE